MTPEDRLEKLEEALEEHLEDFADCRRERAPGELTLTVPREQLIPVMRVSAAARCATPPKRIHRTASPRSTICCR